MKKTWSLQWNNKCVTFNEPIVMGILNATPDSFYNQGRKSDLQGLLATAKQMINDGVKILDIGGMSTRPGADEITPEEERTRILPLIELLKKQFPNTLISVDTYRASVAQNAIDAGVDIINDISGATFEPAMLMTVARAKIPFICMHTQGKPQTMQQQPKYNNVLDEISNYFSERINTLSQAGINQIILDPGFGFGKNLQHNYQLLNHLNLFSQFQKPILVGLSRKSMIHKPLGISPNEALNGTTALHMLALQQGANILRVHDVKEAVQCIQLHQLLKANQH